MLLMALVLAQSDLGCTKDTDCKGERICEAGVCVNPVAPVVPVSAPPPPPRIESSDGWPKIIRRDGQICMQSLDDAGRVIEACRADEPRPRASASDSDESWAQRVERARSERPTEPKRSTFVADLGVTFGIAVAIAGAAVGLPTIAAHGALGGRTSDSLGVMVVLDAALSFNSAVSIVTATLGPGLRIGDAGHVTVALGPTLFNFTGQFTKGNSLAATMLVRGVLPFAGGGFGGHGQVALTFDGSGALLLFSVGIGGSQF